MKNSPISRNMGKRQRPMPKAKTVDMVRMVKLPRIQDPRGTLTFIEEERHIQFKIERVYWIYDVPGGQVRGGHAFKRQQELLVALSGSFDVVVHDGAGEKRFHLNRSYFALYVPAGYWRSLDNFSTNSVAMVLSSTVFDENDYIRDMAEFKKYINYAKIKQL